MKKVAHYIKTTQDRGLFRLNYLIEFLLSFFAFGFEHFPCWPRPSALDLIADAVSWSALSAPILLRSVQCLVKLEACLAQALAPFRAAGEHCRQKRQ